VTDQRTAGMAANKRHNFLQPKCLFMRVSTTLLASNRRVGDWENLDAVAAVTAVLDSLRSCAQVRL
jgi:hypothetical protein